MRIRRFLLERRVRRGTRGHWLPFSTQPFGECCIANSLQDKGVLARSRSALSRTKGVKKAKAIETKGKEGESHRDKINLDKPALVTVRQDFSGISEGHLDKRNLDIPLLVPVRQTDSTIERDSTEGEASLREKQFAEEERIESDSDATVPEPSSPQLYQGMPPLAQKRDLPLCRVLNILREDRHSMCLHALMFLSLCVSLGFHYSSGSVSHLSAVSFSLSLLPFRLLDICVCLLSVFSVATGTSTSGTATTRNLTRRPPHSSSTTGSWFLLTSSHLFPMRGREPYGKAHSPSEVSRAQRSGPSSGPEAYPYRWVTLPRVKHTY